MRNILISFWRFLAQSIKTVGSLFQLLGYVIQGIGNLTETIFGFVSKVLTKFCDKVDEKIEEASNKKGKYEADNQEKSEV